MIYRKTVYINVIYVLKLDTYEKISKKSVKQITSQFNEMNYCDLLNKLSKNYDINKQENIEISTHEQINKLIWIR